MLIQVMTLLGVFLIPRPVIAEEIKPIPMVTVATTTFATVDIAPKTKEYSKADILALVDQYSLKYGVSSWTMNQIIDCESHYQPRIQSRHRYAVNHPEWGVKAGERELSYGLVQIHQPAHPDITRQQAFDPEFSVEFLAKELAKGHGSIWSCYKPKSTVLVENSTSSKSI